MFSNDPYMADKLGGSYLDLMAEAAGLVPDGGSNTYHPGKHCWHDDLSYRAFKCCRCNAMMTHETVHNMTANFRLTYRTANGPNALSAVSTRP